MGNSIKTAKVCPLTLKYFCYTYNLIHKHFGESQNVQKAYAEVVNSSNDFKSFWFPFYLYM